MTIFSSLSCISHILLRHGEASLNEGKARGRRREDGREGGGEGEAAESKREEGALLRLPPLSFRCCAVQLQEGALKGGVWKGGKEREGEKGSAWAALQQLQLQQPDRTREEEKEAEGRKDKAAGLALFF